MKTFFIWTILIILPCTATAQVSGEDKNCMVLFDHAALSFISENPAIAERIISCSENQLSVNYGTSDKTVRITVHTENHAVKETFQFYSLASYYNSARVLPLDNLEVKDSVGKWIAVSGRFKASLYQAPGASIETNSDSLVFSWAPGTPVVLNIISDYKSDLYKFNPEFDSVRYSHLWDWLASLTKLVEWSLVKIQLYFSSSWVWAVILLTVFIKLLLLPVSLITVRYQRQISQYQALLAPQLAAIKGQYDGEEAHQRIMVVYKTLDISPFYTLKPMLGAFIQIPVSVAVFNALGEMHQFCGESFFWIVDLAYPDAVMQLGASIPLLGNTLNLLPLVMTAITVFSTWILQNRYAPVVEVKRQKRNLYLMAAAFLVLFYPFPAVMVFYWTLTNLLQIMLQPFIKI